MTIDLNALSANEIADGVRSGTFSAEAVTQARDALERARSAAADGFSDELVLEDLRAAMHHLGAITGEFTNEDLYDRIFSEFCIGK